MRETRLSGLEGGGAVLRSPYPYPGGKARCFGCFRRVEREVAAVLADGFLRTALFC